MRKFRLVVSTIFVAVALLVATSCTRSGGSGGEGVLNSSILNALPDSTLGFFVWETSSEGYKSFRQSPWGQPSADSLDLLKSLKLDAQGDAAKPFVDALKTAGFIATTPNQPEVVKEGVVFIDNAGGKLAAGVLVSAANGANMKEKLPIFEDAFKKQGMTVTKATVEGADAFTIPLPPQAVALRGITSQVYVSATKDNLAITTSDKLAADIYKNEGSRGIGKLKSTPQFAKAAQNVPSGKSQFSFAYVDVAQLGKSIESLAAAAGRRAEIKSDELPVEAVAYTRGMEGALSDTVSVSFQPKSENQKQVLAELSGGGKSTLLERAPSSVTILIGLDGTTIKAIKTAALANVPPEQAEMMGPVLALVDSLKGFGLGVRAPQGGAPFPDVMLIAESDKAKDLEELLKAQIGMASAMGGMSLGAWQEKDLAGTKISYTSTPLGIGIYMAQTNGSLVIGSSEQSINDLVSAGAGKSEGLIKKLSPATKEAVGTGKSLIVAYSNFEQLGSMIENVSGTVAMFTGGQPPMDAQQMANLKQLGTLTLAINMQDNLLKIQSSYEASKKAA